MRSFKSLTAHLLVCICMLLCVSGIAQTRNGAFIRDLQKGCKVWAPGYDPNDSLTIRWTGPCKADTADGSGTLTFYIKGKQVAVYTGPVHKGEPNGIGKYVFPNGMIQEGNFVNGVMNGKGKVIISPTQKLEGNFKNGEILDLDPALLSHLETNVISHNDSIDLYANDGPSKDLLYDILVPAKKAQAVIVLLPGTWDRLEYVLSSNKELCRLAFQNQIAVIVPSVNQRLTMEKNVLDFLNAVFDHAITKYQLPKNKFILGGFSMGGLFSTRYAEYAYEDPSKVTVVPVAIYSVDGPTDMENIYHNAERAYARKPGPGEPQYILNEFKTYMGGVPDEFRKNYELYSTFSKARADGGNAQFLKNVPYRVYNDVDVTWWLQNRGADLYDMNALDQSAMINFLMKSGNKNAEFINAFGKGYRIEGNRHPHSWSIVDAKDCINWVMKWTK